MKKKSDLNYQEAYAPKILEKYGLFECNIIQTPMEAW